MNKSVKSQWTFGELFAPEETRRIFSVTELTGTIKRLLEQQVGQVWVNGEVTNLRAQSSGHIYFSLKDGAAQLSCVLFRSEAVAHRELLQDGQQVVLQGEVTVYEARGQYQLIVRAVELRGVGALRAAFEKLKRKLEAEGLFDPARKRPLPRFPQRIGLVTSLTGAAIRDVLHVVQRRNPSLEIILVPCRVQGSGAAEEIAAAIRLLNEHHSALRVPHSALDLILVTRGGGSLEDLWAFNEEVVARAIFESALPVVSAVGHEIDSTISDFVADVRAATPSAAAEIITEDVFSSREFVAEAVGLMRQRFARRLAYSREDAAQAFARLERAHPRRRLNELSQRLDDLNSGLVRRVKQVVRERRVAWRNLRENLSRLRPMRFVRQRREMLRQAQRRLQEQTRHLLQESRSRMLALEARLRLLGPEQVLARGYSITMDARTGKVLRDAKEARMGQLLRTRLKAGEITSKVEK